MATPSSHTYIIAEAGVNHDGDEKTAMALIDRAASAGADAVKFQMFDPEMLTTSKAQQADYQKANLGKTESQQSMLAKLTLPAEAFVRLAHHSQTRGIDFLCTPFDDRSLEFLTTRTQMRYLKLASGEVTNGPLLLKAARTQLPIILSTGMSNLKEIDEALAILYFGYTHPAGFPSSFATNPAMLAALKGKVTLLHCVSQYPAPVEATNLLAIDLMTETFGLAVGLSDHSLGIEVALTAVARGAKMIEKHFTHDKHAQGPDHAASLNADELVEMITKIRAIDAGTYHPKPVEVALGKKEKLCQQVEKNTRLVARRSVVAAKPISKGTLFSEVNLVCKRPNDGKIEPNRLWQLLGKPAKADYAADDFIKASELD